MHASRSNETIVLLEWSAKPNIPSDEPTMQLARYRSSPCVCSKQSLSYGPLHSRKSLAIACFYLIRKQPGPTTASFAQTSNVIMNGTVMRIFVIGRQLAGLLHLSSLSESQAATVDRHRNCSGLHSLCMRFDVIMTAAASPRRAAPRRAAAVDSISIIIIIIIKALSASLVSDRHACAVTVVNRTICHARRDVLPTRV